MNIAADTLYAVMMPPEGGTLLDPVTLAKKPPAPRVVEPRPPKAPKPPKAPRVPRAPKAPKVDKNPRAGRFIPARARERAERVKRSRARYW